MRIRKIIEYTDQKAEETFNLIIEEREEGWEMTREEMGKLANLIQESLNIFPMRRPSISIIDIAKKSPLEAYRMDEAEDCPDYIDPPEPEVVCENGACRLVLDEEEPAIQKQSKAKMVAKDKAKKADFSSYIQMYKDGVSSRIIRDKMIDDLDFTPGTADSYFYSKVKKAANTPKAAEKKKEDPELFNFIDGMPNYYSATEFKDACAMADVGRGKYNINALKEIYLDTHTTVRW